MLSSKDAKLGDGGAWRHYKYNLEAMGIPTVNDKTKKQIVKLVDEIIELKKHSQDSSALEGEVDRIVYSLYGLTDEEIKVIEG